MLFNTDVRETSDYSVVECFKICFFKFTYFVTAVERFMLSQEFGVCAVQRSPCHQDFLNPPVVRSGRQPASFSHRGDLAFCLAALLPTVIFLST